MTDREKTSHGRSASAWSRAGNLPGEALMLLRGLADPDMPRHVKILFLLLVAYILCPLDLVPDFIPVLGLLDEVIIVPFAVRQLVRRVPPHVRDRHTTGDSTIHTGLLKCLGTGLVCGIWLMFLASGWLLWQLI